MKNIFIILVVSAFANASELGNSTGGAVDTMSNRTSSFGSSGAKKSSALNGVTGETGDAANSIPGGDAAKSQIAGFENKTIEETIGLIIEPLQKLDSIQGAAPDCNTKYITKIILEMKQMCQTGADLSNMKDKIPKLITQLNGMNRHWDQLRSLVQDPGLCDDVFRTNLSNFGKMLPVIFRDVQLKHLRK